jgi:hypothetical protein
LLAAAVALALGIAYVVGAYAHAAGHHPAHAEYATALFGTGNHEDDASAGGAAAAHHDDVVDYPDSGHGEECPGHSLDCYDTICHGGQAILAAAPVVAAAVLAAPSIAQAALLRGAYPGGPDRPPKPLRTA